MHDKADSIIGQIWPMLPALVLLSFVTNVTVLVSPLFMMHVLDRVVPSGNVSTLGMLAILAGVALLAAALVEFFRDEAMMRAADWLHGAYAARLLARSPGDAATGLRDAAELQAAIGGRTGVALLDLPWMPMFLFALFLIHPAFLILAVCAGLVFVLLAWLGHFQASPKEDAAQMTRRSGMHALANLDGLGPSGNLMGLSENMASRYLSAQSTAKGLAERAQRLRNGYGATTRLFRSAMQIAALATGAMLVIDGLLSPGGMIGASIILAKTIGNIESLTTALPAAMAAKGAARRLSDLNTTGVTHRTEIAELSGTLSANALTSPRGGGASPRIERVTFKLKPGECLAILGESGSGKSTLLNALCGIDPAPIGTSFLDETDVRTLDADTRNTMIGYVPQLGHVLPGTIAQNISRFDPEPSDARILSAARLAGLHGLVSALPEAYETDLGAKPYALSAGQKQRVALARALYSEPRYLFLDEPNALLDHQGERQMGDALYRIKESGTTIVMTLHRMALAQLADTVLVLQDGRVADYGQRSEILSRLTDGHRKLRLRTGPTALQELSDWVSRQFVRVGDEAFCANATVVASELYRFAIGNAPDDNAQTFQFDFKFIDDVTCSLTLSEDRNFKLTKKIKKVREAVDHAALGLPDLPMDEASLATVLRMSASVEHRETDNKWAFLARLTHNVDHGVSH